MSVLLEWDGFGIEDENEATLGLGWDTALGCVDRSRADASQARGPKSDGVLSELLPSPASSFFTAQRLALHGGSVELPQGFAVVIVLAGAGTLGGLEVGRGDALLVPYAAGPVTADGDVTAIVCRPPEAR